MTDMTERADAAPAPQLPASSPAVRDGVVEALAVVEKRWRQWNGIPAPTAAMNRHYATAAKIILQDIKQLDTIIADGTPDVRDEVAMLDLIREEAAKDNSPFGRSDRVALNNIRAILSAFSNTKEAGNG